jgi:phosphonoacetate hydrolase
MQHRYAPHEPESLGFYKQIDQQIGRLLASGCIVAATADHGMNAKSNERGEPNVIFVETLLEDHFGDGATVICPITDPYVVHHGALGSLVMVHLDDPNRAPEFADFLIRQPGITEVYGKSLAMDKLELATDRIGDLCVLSARDVVLGKAAKHHDLSVLHGPLRSHGGRYEEMVPMLLSQRLNDRYLIKALADPRNFDIFDFACNGGADPLDT